MLPGWAQVLVQGHALQPARQARAEHRLSAAVPAQGVHPPLWLWPRAECLLFDLYPLSALLPGVWAAGKKHSPLSHAPRHILMN